jgi:hypothetical protein
VLWLDNYYVTLLSLCQSDRFHIPVTRLSKLYLNDLDTKQIVVWAWIAQSLQWLSTVWIPEM